MFLCILDLRRGGVFLCILDLRGGRDVPLYSRSKERWECSSVL